MPAPAISHLIGTSALIILILVMPLFYFYVVNNINVEMMNRELKEAADYVSNSLENLFLLANSTNCEVVLEKKLDLPSSIRESTYYVEIVYDLNSSAQCVKAYLKGDLGASADSLIVPGLKADNKKGCVIESGDKTVVAGCGRNCTGIYVWIREGV